jgi:hypothetical protein
MAFNLQMFAAGVAENVTETLQEERERAQKLIDDSLKVWTELGVENIKKRRSKRQENKKIVESLKNYNLSPDQIDVILRQGQSENILNTLQTMSRSGIEIKPAEVVSFLPSYKETGRTYDQMLDDYMGKVNRGMDSSDALIDATGGKVKGTFGQDLGKIMTKRVDAFSNAFGLSAPEMRAYAMEDYEYGEGVEGRISLVDPVAKSQAEAAMRGTETGARSFGSASTYLRSFGYGISGGTKAGINPTTGEVLYQPEVAARGIEVDKIVSSLIRNKSEETGRNQFTPNDVYDIEQQLLAWAEEKGYVPQQSTSTTTTTAGAAAAGASRLPPQVGTFTGMTTSSIRTQALKQAKTAKPGDVPTILNDARAAIIADLTKSMGSQRAVIEANKIIQDIQSQI